MSKASAYFKVDQIDGTHGVKEIKHRLGTLPGVLSVSVNNQSEHIAVDFDTTGVECSRLQKSLEQLGYQVLDTRLENHIM